MTLLQQIRKAQKENSAVPVWVNLDDENQSAMALRVVPGSVLIRTEDKKYLWVFPSQVKSRTASKESHA